MDEYASDPPEITSFGGSVGQGVADFDNLEEAQEFLRKGIVDYDSDTDAWLKML